MHGGHISRINEIDWNPNIDMGLASVEEENNLHIYEIPHRVFEDNIGVSKIN